MPDMSVLMEELAVLEEMIKAKKELIENERAALAELLQRLEFKNALLARMRGAGDRVTANHLPPDGSDTISSLSE